jgi:hypothetical protein
MASNNKKKRKEGTVQKTVQSMLTNHKRLYSFNVNV